jgi:GntR family transcriptional regulator, trigonelline degradation regulator
MVYNLSQAVLIVEAKDFPLTAAGLATRTKSLRIEQPPRTLREMALERMRAAIIEFHFRPGQRLVERDLCEQLGVSRSVVREVIRHLEAEGLVLTVPHQGPVVATINAETAGQIYELRALLEAAAAQAAAMQASPADIKRMAAALADIEQAYARKAFAEVLAASNRFYEALFQSAGKQVAWEVVQRLNGRISWLRSMTVSSAGRGASGPKQLRRILSAIRAHDGAAAAAAIRDHLSTASRIAQEMLDANAKQTSGGGFASK